MSTLIAIIIIVVVLAVLSRLYIMFKNRLDFIVNGLDSKFSMSEINTLWEVAKICKLSDPNSLYFSLPSLTKCMTQINNMAASGDSKSQKMQHIMSKLFAFRTKLQNKSDEKKGLDSSMELDKGQRLRIIYPGKGVFVSEIVNNGREIIITMPKQKNMIPIPAEDWIGKTISVYLWRTGDARYVFDTTVTNQGIFLGKLCLNLKHSSNLLRTQKRQAVRAKCNIHASLYILPSNATADYNSVETSKGLRCLLEDISEAGALIRIGGKGVPNMKLKLQFNINNRLVLMFGVVRTVEYNEEINQTRLHFECTHIDQQMKNHVLSYVYDMLPEADKEVYDALSLTASDEADLSSDNEQIKTEVETALNENEGKTESNEFDENAQTNVQNDIPMPTDEVLPPDAFSLDDDNF